MSSIINHPTTVAIGVESGTDIIAGSYWRETIDIQDIAALGSGPASNALAGLTHELVEQATKAFFRLPDTLDAYRFAHRIALRGQALVSGFNRAEPHLEVGERVTGNFARQMIFSGEGGTHAITLIWRNGNLKRVLRH